LRARSRQQTTMSEWVAQTDRFVAFNERGLLKGAGRVSHADMERITHRRYDAFEASRKAAEKEDAERQAIEDLAKLEAEARRLNPPAKKKKRGHGDE
jgi:hypothetical protein